ncbi:MAB_1171c family putative transporter [Streptomyces sp. NPDC004435]|uniref:MAB_1171c family putative transporter n=1 Tax=Streptomyces sp. NPDC004435 TaxID=3364701 RepID=UPI0036A2633E
MKDLLHPLCLVIAGSGFLLLLRDLRAGRRDPALTALAFTYFFSALSYAISLTPVWVRIDGWLGVTNIAVPLAQGCVVLVLGLQASVLAFWTKPATEAARRVRWLMSGALTVIVVMAVLFALLTPVSQRPTDFTLYYAHDPVFQTYLLLYMCTYTAAEIYLARVCWKYARETSDPWIARGLRIIAVGAVITLGYSGIRLLAIFGATYGFSVKPLEPYAWICGDIGATITQIGYFIPLVAHKIAASWTARKEPRQYRTLEPLWRAVSAAEPSIVLVEPGSDSTDVSFHLYRRSVEIRDAQIELRPYLAPEARAAAEQQRFAWWRSRRDRVAAVTAAQIHAALVQRHEGPVEAPSSYADAALDALNPRQELAHLVRVARHFTVPAPRPEPATTSGATRP